MTSSINRKINIGIALGSGSARGWAHIGVLQALKELGIEPNIVAGCSIGAFVGGVYANDQLDELAQWTQSLTRKDILGFLDLSMSRGGFIKGSKLFSFIKNKFGDPDISELNKIFGAVATELNTGREVWLKDGLLFDSVRASAALPGLITPKKYQDQWLIDGGVINPVPVSLCRAMGADIVIAVNLNGDIVKNKVRKVEQKPKAAHSSKLQSKTELNFFEKLSKPLKQEMTKQKSLLSDKFFTQHEKAPSLIDVMSSSINIMQDRITRSRMAGDVPEIIISPKLSHLGLLEFDQASAAIKEGIAAVEKARSALLEIVDLTTE
jgi:NTE family protein